MKADQREVGVRGPVAARGGTSQSARPRRVLDALDRAIVNRLQDGIAVEARPFATCAAELGIDEASLVRRIEGLLADGVLTRFGPMYDAERLGGAFSLCAMAVPAERFDDVAEVVNGFPEVAHNYERAHRLNMWFVVGAGSRADVDRVVAAIAAETGIEVVDLPKIEEFFVGLRLEV